MRSGNGFKNWLLKGPPKDSNGHFKCDPIAVFVQNSFLKLI